MKWVFLRFLNSQKCDLVKEKRKEIEKKVDIYPSEDK